MNKTEQPSDAVERTPSFKAGKTLRNAANR